MPLFNINVIHNDQQFPMVLELDPQMPNEHTILGFLHSGMHYESDVALLMLRALRKGDVAVDVGANVGYFTVLMGLITGPTGRVVSFEPDAENIARLQHNIALNNLANVTLIDRPASATAEPVSFYHNSDNAGGHAIWDPGEFPSNAQSKANPTMIRMQATTLDSEMASLGLSGPRLIKVDTEGAERLVLEGARGLLADAGVPYVIAELHEFGLEKLGSSQRDLRRFMQELGYDTFILYGDGSLPKLLPPDTRVTAPYLINLLFSTQENVASLWPIESFDPTRFFPAPQTAQPNQS
jgi:FkbM family methyltransferase